MNSRSGYLSPKIEVRPIPSKGGYGLFAIDSMQKDEVLAAWGGRIIDYDQLMKLSPEERSHSIQVEEGLYQAPIDMEEAGDFVNHSCDPNAGIRGQIVMVAMRDIEPDEEINLDYAMADSTSYDEFPCSCGAPNCRGQVRAEDWKKPELWRRYDGYFSTYLQRRIDKLRGK